MHAHPSHTLHTHMRTTFPTNPTHPIHPMHGGSSSQKATIHAVQTYWKGKAGLVPDVVQYPLKPHTLREPQIFLLKQFSSSQTVQPLILIILPCLAWGQATLLQQKLQGTRDRSALVGHNRAVGSLQKGVCIQALGRLSLLCCVPAPRMVGLDLGPLHVFLWLSAYLVPKAAFTVRQRRHCFLD